MLWHNGLSFFLLSQHIVLLQVLVAVFMILLPDTLGKAMEHGSSTWAPSILLGDPDGLSHPLTSALSSPCCCSQW